MNVWDNDAYCEDCKKMATEVQLSKLDLGSRDLGSGFKILCSICFQKRRATTLDARKR